VESKEAATLSWAAWHRSFVTLDGFLHLLRGKRGMGGDGRLPAVPGVVLASSADAVSLSTASR
jgi:hypothetical protein